MRDIDDQIIMPLTTEYNRQLKEILDAQGLKVEISYYGDRIAVRFKDYRAAPRYPDDMLTEAIQSIDPDATAVFGFTGAIFQYIEVRKFP